MPLILMGAWYSKEKLKPKPVENAAMVLIGDLGACQKTCASRLGEVKLSVYLLTNNFFS
jgi:hypothetical protein